MDRLIRVGFLNIFQLNTGESLLSELQPSFIFSLLKHEEEKKIKIKWINALLFLYILFRIRFMGMALFLHIEPPYSISEARRPGRWWKTPANGIVRISNSPMER
ncbi:MAG: hypothetical protein GY859_01175 [Desulfobacterales bacterium]|nr:hypothetical protein [Desulfobacterales bacterium]